MPLNCLWLVRLAHSACCLLVQLLWLVLWTVRLVLEWHTATAAPLMPAHTSFPTPLLPYRLLAPPPPAPARRRAASPSPAARWRGWSGKFYLVARRPMLII